MKYITLIIGLLVTGCGKAEPELTLEEKVVGTYEREGGRGGWKLVLLNTGVFEVYSDGKKEEEAKWKISKDGELHAIYGDGRIIVLRINKDRSITTVAALPKEEQITLHKIN